MHVAMTTISSDRQNQLQKIDEFIEISRNKLASIAHSLGWSVESISKDVRNMVVCPFDELHHIPEQSLDKHLSDCQWKAEGYGMCDLPFSISSLAPGAPTSIKFDEQLQDDVIQNAKEKNPLISLGGASGRLIPRTSDRLIAKFTREERCAMYDYVIANTVEPDIGDDIADMNKPKASRDGKTSSYLELLAQERNLKRRRAKYRGVHTNKKSQIEILREVVNQQMEMLTEYISEKHDDVVCNLSTNDGSRDREYDGNMEERNDCVSRSDYIESNRGCFSVVNYDGQSHSSKRSENHISLRRPSDDRRCDRGNNPSRHSHWRKERSTEIGNCSKEHDRSDRKERYSCERRSHKSGHKRHGRVSKDRHDERRKRNRSREPDKSRPSRDSEYNDRRSESGRHSLHDDRRIEKKKKSL